MASRHNKRLKQDDSLVIDDEVALSGQDTDDEMDQCSETCYDKDFIDSTEPSPMDEDGSAEETKAESVHHTLAPGWVDATTVLSLLPYESHRPEWEQKVDVVEINEGAEIAFFKGLTKGHNRSVDALARLLGMDMTTFLQNFIVMPILRQGKNGPYANWAVFNGSRKQWIEEVIMHLSVPYQHRPDLMQPLCEMIVNGIPLRLYFDIERYVVASEGRAHAEVVVVQAFMNNVGRL
jgi:hypothetical protein